MRLFRSLLEELGAFLSESALTEMLLWLLPAILILLLILVWILLLIRHRRKIREIQNADHS